MSFSFEDPNLDTWAAYSNGNVYVTFDGYSGFDTGAALSVSVVTGATESNIYLSYGSATAAGAGQSVTATGSGSGAQVSVTRRTDVLNDGAGHYYLRLVETVTNTGTAAATFRATVSDNIYTDTSTAIPSTSSGDTVFSTADDWYVTNSSSSSSRPAFAHVVSGGQGAPSAAGQADVDDLSASYDMTLAAGESASIVHFITAATTPAAAAALAAQLASFPASALTGLTDAELSRLINIPTDVSSAVTTTLEVYQRNLTLIGAAAINGTGNASDNALTGNAAANSLYGLAGNDTLDGGAGADRLEGGTGNDSYYVDTAGDVVVELANSGIDTVYSRIGYSIAALPYVENVTLIGAAAINATGNTAANILVGNGAANILEGGAGNDTLNGGAGVDQLRGGAGNDSYYVDAAGDTVVEAAAQGVDAVFASVTYSIAALANVENVTLLGSGAIGAVGNAGANVLNGNSGQNTLSGGAGNDTLDGNSGADRMLGGTGNDSYHVDRQTDVLVENAAEGTDTVFSDAESYTLSANVENLVLENGASVWRGTGNGQANLITGNSTDNFIDGGAGSDTMVGGLGSDTYVVDAIGDVITEGLAAGLDTVISRTAAYTLGSNLENLRLAGSALNAAGNSLDNAMTGNVRGNALSGNAGNDTLRGSGGADTLSGGDGDDFLLGDDDVPGQVLVAGEGTSNGVSIALNLSAPEVATGSVQVSGTISSINLTQVPINVVYVIDHSGSMSDTFSGTTTVGDLNGDGRSNTTLDAAIASFEQLNQLIDASGFGAAINVALIPFEDSASVAYSGTPSADADGNGVADVIDVMTGLTPAGGTDYTDALQTTVDWINGQSSGLNAVFFLSDGEPNDQNYVSSILPSLWALGRGGTIIRAIGTGTGADQDILDYLDDGLYNGSAEIVTDPQALELGLSDVLVGATDGAWVEIYRNGALVDVVGNDDFTITPFGLQFTSGNIALSASGTDTITATLVTSDAGGRTISVSLPIAIGTVATADVLSGGNGNDTLDGGLGADRMRGDLGDDVYYVDNASDQVTELISQGTDTVITSINGYTLGEYVENLTLNGAAVSGNGNGSDNTLTGNAVGNLLNGNAGDDLLSGLAGNDTLNGGLGADTLRGGAGNDTYYVDDSYDRVEEAYEDETSDTVISAFSASLGEYVSGVSYSESFYNVENLTLMDAVTALNAIGSEENNILTGNALGNALYGFDGNDRLDGGSGLDTMDGGAGNDTYLVRQAGETLVDASGADTIISFLSSYTLSSGFENLSLAALSSALTAIGNAGANALSGNAYNNTLNGGAGADTMSGGAGNDTYLVESIGDRVREVAGGGVDRVVSSISYMLGANVENLTLSGTASIGAAGNELANVLVGNAGANRMLGLAGADALSGGAGNDTLLGGAGSDTLVGGAGRDCFVFNSAPGAGNLDRISDFSVADDVIWLDNAIFTSLAAGALPGTSFVANATGLAADVSDRVIYETDTGALWYDADGTASGGRMQVALLSAGLAVTAADFTVV